MGDSKQNLTSAIQIVVTLFAAFGAVLGDFLPAQIDTKGLIYGVAQFLSLLLFLLIKIVIIKRNDTIPSFRWKIFAIAMIVGFLISVYFYYSHSSKHLKSIPGFEAKVISGELTEESRAICNDPIFIRDNPKKLPCEDALIAVGIDTEAHLIWTKESVQRNVDIFVFLYVLIIGTLSAAIFSMIELFPIQQRN